MRFPPSTGRHKYDSYLYIIICNASINNTTLVCVCVCVCVSRIFRWNVRKIWSPPEFLNYFKFQILIKHRADILYPQPWGIETLNSKYIMNILLYILSSFFSWICDRILKSSSSNEITKYAQESIKSITIIIVDKENIPNTKMLENSMKIWKCLVPYSTIKIMFYGSRCRRCRR